jgi:hypothetical protein
MKITYRPEIQGLRAIAVTAVIFYHAQITIFGYQFFKGGFIGVDIFFVVSGYLITSIILKELVTTSSFSFKHFFEARIRRIFPALLFVMLISLPFAWIYLIPSSFVDFSKSILYSLGFSSNFYFNYSDQKYGAESALLKPFLHIWSLSVEKQYYILFPIFLHITFKYFKKHLLTIILICLIISLQISDWSIIKYPSITFYSLHTRLWQLLAGSTLAYLEITKGHRSKNQILNLILPTFGLFLIAHSILFFHDKMLLPSFYSLFPIIGVCLIIWFSNKDELITKVLSTKLFVGIGLISYSLYLWHHPIFVFDRIVEFSQDSLFKKLLLGIIVLILSIISYYLVERPSRNKEIKFKVIISSVIISVFILIIYNLNIIQNDGYKNRLPEILGKNLQIEMNWDLLKNSSGKNCHSNVEGCKFNISSNRKVYIVGDSHAGSLIFDLKDRVVKKNYQFIVSTVCIYFPSFNLVNRQSGLIDEKCNNNYYEKLKQTLSKENNSIIIFAGRFPLNFSGYRFDNQEGGIEEGGIKAKEIGYKYISLGKHKTIQDSFTTEVLELSKNNKIILIYPIPEVGVHVPIKLINFFKTLNKNVDKKNIEFNNFITTSYKVYIERTNSSFELLDSINGENIYRVYPHKLFCDKTIKDRCTTHDDNNVFYSDDNHLSLKGAEMVNDLIIKEIENIELKSK